MNFSNHADNHFFINNHIYGKLTLSVTSGYNYDFLKQKVT